VLTVDEGKKGDAFLTFSMKISIILYIDIEEEGNAKVVFCPYVCT
jgi:hypothetical protein